MLIKMEGYYNKILISNYLINVLQIKIQFLLFFNNRSNPMKLLSLTIFKLNNLFKIMIKCSSTQLNKLCSLLTS
jgi:hypothetical protein